MRHIDRDQGQLALLFIVFVIFDAVAVRSVHHMGNDMIIRSENSLFGNAETGTDNGFFTGADIDDLYLINRGTVAFIYFLRCFRQPPNRSRLSQKEEEQNRIYEDRPANIFHALWG